MPHSQNHVPGISEYLSGGLSGVPSPPPPPTLGGILSRVSPLEEGRIPVPPPAPTGARAIGTQSPFGGYNEGRGPTRSATPPGVPAPELFRGAGRDFGWGAGAHGASAARGLTLEDRLAGARSGDFVGSSSPGAEAGWGMDPTVGEFSDPNRYSVPSFELFNPEGIEKLAPGQLMYQGGDWPVAANVSGVGEEPGVLDAQARLLGGGEDEEDVRNFETEHLARLAKERADNALNVDVVELGKGVDSNNDVSPGVDDTHQHTAAELSEIQAYMDTMTAFEYTTEGFPPAPPFHLLRTHNQYDKVVVLNPDGSQSVKWEKIIGSTYDPVSQSILDAYNDKITQINIERAGVHTRAEAELDRQNKLQQSFITSLPQLLDPKTFGLLAASGMSIQDLIGGMTGGMDLPAGVGGAIQPDTPTQVEDFLRGGTPGAPPTGFPGSEGLPADIPGQFDEGFGIEPANVPYSEPEPLFGEDFAIPNQNLANFNMLSPSEQQWVLGSAAATGLTPEQVMQRFGSFTPAGVGFAGSTIA